MEDIPDVTAENWQSVCWSKYRESLDYFGKEIAETLMLLRFCLGK